MSGTSGGADDSLILVLATETVGMMFLWWGGMYPGQKPPAAVAAVPSTAA